MEKVRFDEVQIDNRFACRITAGPDVRLFQKKSESSAYLVCPSTLDCFADIVKFSPAVQVIELV